MYKHNLAVINLNVKTKELTKTSIKRYLLGTVLHMLSFVCGFLLSRTVLFSKMLSLGIAFSVAAPLPFTLSASFGAFIGYFVPVLFGQGLKYIAILFGTVCLRIITVKFKDKYDTPLTVVVITAIVTLFTGLISIEDFSGLNFLFLISEVILTSSFAYFINKTFRREYLESGGINNSDLTALIVTANIILLGFFNVRIEEISIGRILAVVLLLSASHFRQTSAGAICGIPLSLTLWLSGFSAEMALMVTIGGLACGFFAPFSKLMSALSLMFTAIITTLITNLSSISISFMVETFIGGIIFLIMPKKVYSVLGSVFSQNANIQSLDGLKNSLITRLSFASGALRGVNEMVDTVSQKLEKYNNTDYSTVLRHIENDACKGCLLRINCWEKNREDTLEAVLNLTTALKRGKSASLIEVPAQFADRCLRLERFENSVGVHYSEFLTSLQAENRIREMREIVSEQMVGIADMLGSLSKEFSETVFYDSNISERVVSVLKNIDLRVSDCGCVIDKFNRMTLEIKLSHTPKDVINRKKILQILEQTCDRTFETPLVNKVNGEVYITVSEKAKYSIDFAISQINSNNNMLSGDAADGFYDGKGRFFMMLSDGMGTGSRAAVDSAMVIGLMSKLIKAGFSYNCALKIVNSALVYKSTDESSATIDITSIDLFNGKTELLKAGAAPTVVRRSGRAGKAECHSLPVGILKEVGFDRAIITLKEKDVVVMMSDGVCTDGIEWITAEVESFYDKSAKQLANRLADFAKRRREDAHQDDITVMVAVIEKQY